MSQVIETMVTERIVAALKAGVVPWRRPWRLTGGGLPRNIKSNKAYRGSNVFILGLAGHTSPWWGTWKQWAELGASVKPGLEKEYSIVTYWSRKPRRVDDPENPGQKKTVQSFIFRYTKAWNAEQVDNVPEKFLVAAEPVSAPEAHAQAQKVLDAYYGTEGAPRHFHDNPDRAFYSPASDFVNTPPIESYAVTDQAEYYSTEFHEATHSTGHSTRCDREGIEKFDHFGSDQYSKEELVAEMGAAMLGAITGVETDSSFGNSAAYIASWLSKLENDPQLVVAAAGKAQHAVDFVQGTTFEAEA